MHTGSTNSKRRAARAAWLAPAIGCASALAIVMVAPAPALTAFGIGGGPGSAAGSEPTAFAHAKHILSQHVPISRDWWHLALGVGITALAAVGGPARERGQRLVTGLVVATVLGVGMEIHDAALDLSQRALFRAGEYVSDVALTVAAPFAGVAIWRWARRGRALPPGERADTASSSTS